MVAEVLRLMGRAVSFGHAVGPAFILKKNVATVPEFTISKEQIPQEWSRFENACKIAEQQLLTCKTFVENGSKVKRGEVFDIQIALLKDSYILQELKRTLQVTLKNIETCWTIVIKKCMKVFCEREALPALKNDGDLQDICQRLLCILTGEDVGKKITHKKGCICVTKNLEPSDVITLKNAGISGIVLENDCVTSHAIILAKSLRIPILTGVKDACTRIKDNAVVEIDSEMGACWVNKKNTSTTDIHTLTLPDSFSLSGQNVHFYLAYDGCHLPLLQKSTIDGIGLVRTELLFFNRETLPDEEEQFLFYKDIVTSAHGKPVTLRTLDIGGDKLPNGQCSQELNPFLGLRGIRYCLKHETIFRQQLLAMLRASAFGCVRILYPMISDVQELVHANQILEECKHILANKQIAFCQTIQIGAMLETPSAVLCMNDLAAYCDFFSIGTNDLIQYILAVDRTNPVVANLYQITHPSVFRCLHFIAKQANKQGKEVLVCGELPNGVVPFLMCLGLGFRSFVAYENHIPYLAHLCNKIDRTALETLTTQALNITSSDAIFSIFEKYYKKILNEIKNF